MPDSAAAPVADRLLLLVRIVILPCRPVLLLHVLTLAIFQQQEAEQEWFNDSFRCNITTNYRSTKTVVEESNLFMAHCGMSGPFAQFYTSNGVGLTKTCTDINTVFVAMNEEYIDFYRDYKYRMILPQDGNKPANKRIAAYLKTIIEEIVSPERKGESFLLLSRTNYCLGCPDLAVIQKQIQKFLVEEECFTEKEANQITVKTIHKSKGDEADNVILLETNFGSIPKLHADTELYSIFGEDFDSVLLDEMRLFYVAITRAKKHLTILYDYIDGQGKVQPSPFLAMMQNS